MRHGARLNQSQHHLMRHSMRQREPRACAPPSTSTTNCWLGSPSAWLAWEALNPPARQTHGAGRSAGLDPRRHLGLGRSSPAWRRRPGRAARSSVRAGTSVRDRRAGVRQHRPARPRDWPAADVAPGHGGAGRRGVDIHRAPAARRALHRVCGRQPARFGGAHAGVQSVDARDRRLLAAARRLDCAYNAVA